MHAGAISGTRLATVKSDLYTLGIVPAARVQIGDATDHGTTSEDTTFKTWWDGLPAAPVRALVCGNHDIFPTRFSGGNRTAAQWATAYGLSSQNYTVDLGFVRLIIVGQSTYPASDAGEEMTWSSSDVTFLDDALTAAGSQDCWILSHAPLYNTVLGNGATEYLSTDADFSAQVDADIRAVLAAHSNAKAWISGHTHSPLSATGLLTTQTIGSHTMAFINVSSIYYTGKTVDAGDTMSSFYITKVSGAIEVRVRDHGSGAWTTVGGNLVTTLTL